MAVFAIVWRNPNHVTNRLRWSEHAQIGSRTVYVVEQLLSAERDVWVNASIIEVIRGRDNRPAPHHQKPRWRLGFGC